MKLLWYSCANIIYALGSLGYLAINLANLIDRNTVESPVTYIILVILAVVFVIDALLYTFDWIEQRSTKKRRELIACLLNVIGSILYMVGAIVFKTKQTSSSNSIDLSDIPTFVFSILGMLLFLAESILTFFIPRVTKTTSICSVEFFARLLNLIGNISYLAAHIIQPITSFVASFTTQSLNKLTDLIYIVIRPVQIGGDIIYTIDAILYIIVWIQTNDQLRKIGSSWVEQGNAALNKIVQKQQPELILENVQSEAEHLPLQTVSKQVSTIPIEEVKPAIKNSAEVESIE